MNQDVDVSSLVGQEFDFFGAASNVMGLGGRYLEVVEDPDDGYRSSLDCVREVDAPTGLFATPVGRVRVEAETEWLWTLVDVATGHTWLRFGTDYYDDYYPMFRFDYYPQKAQ